MEAVLIYGLVNSAELALVAIGLSLTFGISRVANFAIGGLYVFAGYFPWLLMKHFGLPLPLVAVLSIIVTAAIGAVLYRTALLRVRGYMLGEVIVTFAVGIGILELIRAVGLIGFAVKLPVFVRGEVSIAGVLVDYQRLFVVVIGLLAVLGIWLFTRRSKIGLAFRAIAQNERTALAFGIKSDRIAMLSLAAGSALTAIAALTILPLGLVNVDRGYDILLIAIAVGIVGGLESIAGVMLASFLLGYTQTIVAMYLSTRWVMVVFLAAIILVLAIRPSGLLGKYKELEERV